MDLRYALNALGYELGIVGIDPYARYAKKSGVKVEFHLNSDSTDDDVNSIFVPTHWEKDKIQGIDFKLPEEFERFLGYLEGIIDIRNLKVI